MVGAYGASIMQLNLGIIIGIFPVATEWRGQYSRYSDSSLSLWSAHGLPKRSILQGALIAIKDCFEATQWFPCIQVGIGVAFHVLNNCDSIAPVVKNTKNI